MPSDSFGERVATPLPIHKAAFARMAPGIDLPPEGRERLRKAFQAAERKGLPGRDIDRAISQVVGDYIWRWPWFEATALSVQRAGWLPLDWAHQGITMPVTWDAIPHNVRVTLLCGALCSAVYNEKQLDAWQAVKPIAGSRFRPRLQNHEPRCAASSALMHRHAAAVAACDFAELPPYFAGDHTALEVA